MSDLHSHEEDNIYAVYDGNELIYVSVRKSDAEHTLIEYKSLSGSKQAKVVEGRLICDE